MTCAPIYVSQNVSSVHQQYRTAKINKEIIRSMKVLNNGSSSYIAPTTFLTLNTRCYVFKALLHCWMTRRHLYIFFTSVHCEALSYRKKWNEEMQIKQRQILNRYLKGKILNINYILIFMGLLGSLCCKGSQICKSHVEHSIKTPINDPEWSINR